MEICVIIINDLLFNYYKKGKVTKILERDAKGTFELSYVIEGGINYKAYTYLDDEERKQEVKLEWTIYEQYTHFRLTDTCETNQNPIFTNLVIIHK